MAIISHVHLIDHIPLSASINCPITEINNHKFHWIRIESKLQLPSHMFFVKSQLSHKCLCSATSHEGYQRKKFAFMQLRDLAAVLSYLTR